jgi:hypothetical protein
MRRRRLLLVAGALALLGLAGLATFLWLTTPPPGVSRDNFYRLRKGMTLQEVEAILGEPGVEEHPSFFPWMTHHLIGWGTSDLNPEMFLIEVCFEERDGAWRLDYAMLDGELQPETPGIHRLLRLLPW